MPQPIDADFAQFVVRFATELDTVQSFIDTAPTGGEPEREAEVVYQRFAPWLDGRLGELESHAKRLGPDAAADHGAYFRSQLYRFTEHSAFLKRTNDRPRGYAGDSEMMRMLYDRDFRGDSVFGKVLHRHPVESAAAQAVRARVELVSSLVQQQLRRQAGDVRVLSVACGPARELRHHLPTAEDAARTEFVLVDQDVEALAEAKAEALALEQRIGVPIRARCEQVSVRELIAWKHTTRELLGEFDLVYSMGLYDYLAQPVARRLTERLWAMTRPGATLVIGNFHVDTATRTYLDYWMNWPLTYRTEAQLLALAHGLPELHDGRVEFEATRSQMFLVLRRAGR